MSSRKEPTADPAVIYRRLLHLCTPYWGVFLIGVVGMAMFALAQTSVAFIVKEFITILMEEELTPDQQAIKQWFPMVFLALFLVRGVGGFLSTYCLGWIGRRVIRVLRSDIFKKYMNLPTRIMDRNSSGELLSKLTYNIEQVAEATSNVVTVVIRDSLTILGIVGSMLWFSPVLTLIVFIVAPVITFLIRFLSRVFRRHSARIQGSMGDVTRIAEEALQSHRIVKIFNRQQYEQDRFDVANEKNRRLHMRLFASKAGGAAATLLVAALAMSGVVQFALSDTGQSIVTGGDFIAFISAMGMLMRPLQSLTNVNVALQRGIAAATSVFALLDEDDELDEGTWRPGRVEGRVEFREVGFTYAAEKGPVLQDISLVVPAGQTLAIVGRSGSGKSTLVNLLPRFYNIQSGELLLDDVSVSEYALDALRDQISLVSQEVVLFDDTIANNIAYGALGKSSPQAIAEAAGAAHVNEFAEQLPEGLETRVGDRGVLLSGGQRQRIAIARALLKDAPVLILDEATSALDTESEKHIQQALVGLMTGRTTLVIAHRLSTIENADQIIVMAAGRIVESGTHDELIRHQGHYARLRRLQFKDEPE